MSAGPRIALSGSGGVGKSTLGRALADRLGVPYVAEGMRQRLESGLDLHTLDRAGLRGLITDLWDEQEAAEQRASREAGGFVADRCSLDFAALRLLYGYVEEADAPGAFLERMRTHAAGYQAVVVLPWGVLPLEADGVRSSNRWLQLRAQCLIEGLLARSLRAEQRWLLPDATLNLKERVDWVWGRWAELQ